jgi:hypothetical protein
MIAGLPQPVVIWRSRACPAIVRPGTAVGPDRGAAARPSGSPSAGLPPAPHPRPTGVRQAHPDPGVRLRLPPHRRRANRSRSGGMSPRTSMSETTAPVSSRSSPSCCLTSATPVPSTGCAPSTRSLRPNPRTPAKTRSRSARVRWPPEPRLDGRSTMTAQRIWLITGVSGGFGPHRRNSRPHSTEGRTPATLSDSKQPRAHQSLR